MPVPPPKFHRLFPGNEVRLMGAYIVKCTGYNADENGRVTEVLCEVDLTTKSGSENSGRKVKGTIHWVPAEGAVPIECHLIDNLFLTVHNTNLDEAELNPDSLVITQGYAEPVVAAAKPSDTYQFVRQGYFCRDTKFPERMVFIRTVSLKSSYKPQA